MTNDSGDRLAALGAEGRHGAAGDENGTLKDKREEEGERRTR